MSTNPALPKLTPEQALEIRRRARIGREHSTKAIARDYGIDPSTVRRYARAEHDHYKDLR